MLQAESFSPNRLGALRERGELFVVLDACDEPSVPILCDGLGDERCVSLYRGEAEEVYADIAPYLVHVDSDEVLEWVTAFSRKIAWGIVLVAPTPLQALRTHLRKFLKVLDPDGKRLYFRFYDPRVMEMFLPTCDASQLEEFFGPVKAYAVMSPERGVVAWRRAGSLPVVEGA
jgi:hypothetical protein